MNVWVLRNPCLQSVIRRTVRYGARTKQTCHDHIMAMGQNPNRTPSEHPNPTTKIGSKLGGEFTYPQMGSHSGFEPWPHGKNACYMRPLLRLLASSLLYSCPASEKDAVLGHHKDSAYPQVMTYFSTSTLFWGSSRASFVANLS